MIVSLMAVVLLESASLDKMTTVHDLRLNARAVCLQLRHGHALLSQATSHLDVSADVVADTAGV